MSAPVTPSSVVAGATLLNIRQYVARELGAFQTGVNGTASYIPIWR